MIIIRDLERFAEDNVQEIIDSISCQVTIYYLPYYHTAKKGRNGYVQNF